VACAVYALVGVLVALALGGTVLAAIVAVPLVVLAAGRHGRRARRRVSAPA
jgi:ABC-type phosphate/phosphonate transport system permease subunit